MDTNKSLKPSIYYVVQGRRTENDSDYIEHTFMNVNPLEARERAFAYLEYYVQLLQQGKKIVFKQKDKVIEEEIKLEYFNKYSVSFTENNFGIDGIAIYMVVNEPIDYMDKLDKAEDRYLIYAVQNLTEEKIENLKNSLIREYGYYRYSKIDISKEEEHVKMFTRKKNKSGYNSILAFTIIKTPFDFYFAKIKIDDSNLFCSKVANDFKVINLKNTTFISKLDWHSIRVHVASFLNTDGGKVYLGKFVNGKIINCLENKNITECTKLLKQNILKNFPKHNYKITFRFVKINQVLVPIIVVKASYRKFCFYDIETNNEFYFRNNNGLQKMNQTEKIAEYVLKNGEYKLSDLAAILDQL
jgi:Putative DNA-binding domain